MDPARDRDVVDQDTIGVHEFDDVAARRGVGAVQEGLAARQDGALDRHTRVLPVDQDVLEQRVGARVHEDRVTRVQVVLVQQGREAGHGRAHGLAVVGVVARGRRVLVVRRVRVAGDVHEVVGAVVGDQERVVRFIGRHGQIVRRGPDRCRVGTRHRARRPEEAAAAEGVHGRSGRDRGGERGAAVGREGQIHSRVRHAAGIRFRDLDAR